MVANPRQRILAALLDIAVLLLWGVLVLAGVAVAAAWGDTPQLGPFGYNLIAVVLVVLPVTVAFTVWEAGRYEATPGKQKVGLRVRTDPGGERLSWQRSAARNLLKFGVPWTLAQSAVLALFSAPAADAAVGVIFAIGVPIAYLASLVIWGNRTVYDWLLGTTVISVAAGRRFAADDSLVAEAAEAEGQPAVGPAEPLETAGDSSPQP